MNITVRKVSSANSYITGGECACLSLEISIDEELPIREQRRLVTHAIIENYCWSWTHDKVDQLTDFITEALDQLEER